MVAEIGEECPAGEVMRPLLEFATSILAIPQPNDMSLEVAQLRCVLRLGLKSRQLAVALGVDEVWLEAAVAARRASTLHVSGMAYLRLQRLHQILLRRRQCGYGPETTATWWDAVQAELGGMRPRQAFADDDRKLLNSIVPSSLVAVRHQGHPETPPREWLVGRRYKTNWT